LGMAVEVFSLSFVCAFLLLLAMRNRKVRPKET
jgi:hypothetical protein